ncbi:MAG: 2-oxo acid dehydrogenase subunit E2 [Alphaproteobacteria bacterium]|nr:2-oxo acid dehydrogenase subunit E2 [Alphaproteobacteria bacterium]
MPIIFEMPSLSPTMEKGNLVTWCKNEGAEVAVGDLIAEIDTDKATMEVESIYKGVLAKILVPAGTHDVAVKTPIAIIRQKDDTDEDIAHAMENISNMTKVNQNDELAQSEKSVEPACNTFLDTKHSEVSASPLAKRLANEYGMDITQLSGSGPHGRIVKQDILSARETLQQSKHIEMNANRPRYVDTSATSMQKLIAEKLTKVKQEVPHFYMSTKVDVTSLINLRKKLNDNENLDTTITVTDLLVKAIAVSMSEEPGVNVMWNNGSIRHFNTVDISIAVATDNGIITPIIWDADKKSLMQISRDIKALAVKAKEKSLSPEQYTGGALTISNLGMFGIDTFYSIINPPQASILSIGSARKEPIVGEDGNIKIADIMQIGYAIDHRAIDGATAAKFLHKVATNIQNVVVALVR